MISQYARLLLCGFGQATISSPRAIKGCVNDAIKAALSPRFVPNEIFQVAEIPRTLTGKNQEPPIKKLLLGEPLEKVVNKDAMVNPVCLARYVDFAVRHRGH